MKKEKKINVFSEIGKLKVVLTHRPNVEVENIAWTPNNSSTAEKWKFELTMNVKKAQKEHDAFTKLMKDNQINVLYIEDLVVETLNKVKENKDEIKNKLINKFIEEAKIKDNLNINNLKDYLLSLSLNKLVEKMIGGIKIKDLNIEANSKDENPFICEPLPNLLFQRDPFSSIGNGITINKMESDIRNRETIFADFIFKYHPHFKGTKKYYNRDLKFSLEGGDILILNKKTLIIGVTERTHISSINEIIKNLIKSSSSFKKIIVIDIKEKLRRFMHLDTIFTNIDFNVFLVHPIIFNNQNQFKIYEFNIDNQKRIEKKEINKNLKAYLSEVIGQNVIFIPCGRKNENEPDIINEMKEQFDDATNVLTIKPKVVIAYDRNIITNKLLREKGITVLEIPSSELSRGLGGPRCMTMPIIREDI
jgi:arginine deiminase